MCVIGHTMDGEQFLALSGHDASNVFVKLFLPLKANQILPFLNGKDYLNVNLGVSVGHWRESTRRAAAASTVADAYTRAPSPSSVRSEMFIARTIIISSQLQRSGMVEGLSLDPFMPLQKELGD